jgi:hypothetical protein
LLSAVNARFDELETRVSDAQVAKSVAFDRELCAVDVVLERLRGERLAATDAITSAQKDATKATDAQHAEWTSRLDQADAMLLALPPRVVEPPRIDVALDEAALGALYTSIASLGDVVAPRAAQVLVRDLSDHADDDAVFHAGCTELAAYAPDQLQVAIDVGLCSSLVGALERRRTVDAAEMACKVLANVTLYAAGIQAAVAAAVPRALVLVLARHADYFSIAKHACAALSRIAKEEPGRQAVAQASGDGDDTSASSMLVCALLAHPRDSGVVRDSCNALASIAEFFRSADRSKKYPHIGMPEAIVAALRALPGEASVVLACLAALAGASSFPVINVEAVRFGAAAAIVDAMRTHAGNAAVAMQGCYAINALAFCDPGEDAVVRAGAAAAVIAAFRAHTYDADVAMSVCGAIRNMIDASASKNSLMRAGVFDVLVEALCAFPTRATIMEDCCVILAHLTDKRIARVSEDCSEETDAVIVSRILGVLELYPGNAELALNGCTVIGNIATRMADDIRCHAITVLVTTLRTHVSATNIVTQACRALKGVAGSEPHAVIHEEAISAIVAAMHAHAHDNNEEAVIEASSDALSCFVSSLAGQQAAVNAGAPAVLVMILNKCTGPSAMRLVCDMLARIMQLPAGKRAATDAGALKAVLAVLHAFPNAKLVTAATHVLEALLATDDAPATESLV